MTTIRIDRLSGAPFGRAWFPHLLSGDGAAQALGDHADHCFFEMKWLKQAESAAATFEGEFLTLRRVYAGQGVVRAHA